MDQELIIEFYREMLRIRRFEETAQQLIYEKHFNTPFFSARKREAVAVGVASVMEEDDFVLSSTSCFPIYLARGGDITALFAELAGKKFGCCQGRTGLLNLFDIEHRIIGGWSLSGVHLPLAVGFSFAQLHHEVSNVTVCFLNNADIASGFFYETINLVNLWHLPVIFILQHQHNLFLNYKQQKHALLANLKGFNCESVDGINVFNIRGAVHIAMAAARDEHLSSLIEVHIPPIDCDEIESDPLNVLVKKLNAFKKYDERQKVQAEIEKEIMQAKLIIED